MYFQFTAMVNKNLTNFHLIWTIKNQQLNSPLKKTNITKLFFATYQLLIINGHSEQKLGEFLSYPSYIESQFFLFGQKKNLDNSETLIYRKPPYINCYLNCNSNHPIMMEKNIVKSLLDGAK